MTASSRRRHNRTQTLLRGLRSSGLCVIYHEADLAVGLVENAPPSWPAEPAIRAAGDAAIFDPFTAERILATKREVLATGEPQRIEAPQRRDGEDLLWFELNIEQDRDADAVRGLFVSVTDITQIKRREAALRDLIFEVSHRSRNMLAILQSILGQTADTAGSVREFEEKFRGRIASIAQSQDLITYANWQAVRFRRLVETQVAPFFEDSGVLPLVEGADPLLSPHVALHLGLALHELAANSHAFGVLRQGGGVIRIIGAPVEAGWKIEWIESPKRPLRASADAKGFGWKVLQQVVPRALHGEATYALSPSGVHYALRIPDPDGEGAKPNKPPLLRSHA